MAVRTMMAWGVLAVALVAFPASTPHAQTPPVAVLETPALQAIVLDGETGAVLFEKSADEPFPPASLAKLMTLELAFRALETGLVSPDTAYRVSENAWRTGGAPSRTSTMFAEVRSNVPVDALVRGVAIQQANDASIILAEGMEGTEGAFVQAMNERAAELGLASSRFVNATGLPAEGQQITARDIARLGRHLNLAYPAWYALFAEPEFTWNGIRQRNRNPLLGLNIGATGVATGFAEGAGYAILGSAEGDGRTTFVALGGLADERVRSREAARVLDWAKTTFDQRSLFAEGASVGRALVYGGTRPDVAVRTDREVVAMVPRNAPQLVSGAVVYDAPLRAPIAAGERVGQLEIRLAGRPSIVQDVFASEDVPEGTFTARALGAAQELAFGWIRAL